MSSVQRQRPGVLIVTPNLDVGGAQETVVNVARSLQQLGTPVVVATFEGGLLQTDLADASVPVEVLDGRRHGVLTLPRFLLEMARFRRRLRSLIGAHRVGIVLTQGLGTLDFLVATLRIDRGLQVWWTIQNARFMLRDEHLTRHRWMLEPKRRAHRILYRWGSRIVNGVIAVSDETADAFRAEVGDVGDRVRVVYNSVDMDRYPARNPGSELRRELGLAPDAHVLTMVGTFKAQKGHTHLLDAVAKLFPRHPNLRLLLVGDGGLRVECEEQARRLGLEEAVVFLGTRRDVPELLAVSNAFVLPSLWEGLSLALIEAMASGLPVVATDVSGSSLAVVDGETGWLVSPGDPAPLAAALEELIEDAEEAHDRGLRGRARAETLFSARAQAERLVALFQEARWR